MNSRVRQARWKISGGLARRLVLQLGLALLLVTAPVTWLAYENSVRGLQERSREELELIVGAHARDAAELFTMAERQTAALRDEYLRRLDETPAGDSRAGFERWFERQADGLVRVRRTLDDHRRLPSLYLRPQVPLTDDVVQRTWVAFQLLREWGPVTTQRYYSTYFDLPGEGLIMHSPSVNWGAEATPETNNFDYPPVAGASPARNPRRENTWTPVYFDDKAGIYMVSTVRPIDRAGAWIACVSQDVSIDELLRRTQAEALPGTYNAIVGRNGHVIAHPAYAGRLQAASSPGQPGTLRDPIMEEVAALPVALDGSVRVQPSRDGLHWFAAANIRGPDWIYVAVVPTAVLQQRALVASRWLLVGGALALLLLMTVIYGVARHQIGRPLAALQRAAEGIEQGRFDVRLDRRRPDELGRLAGAFLDMGQELQARQARLQEQLAHLKASERRFRAVFDQSPGLLAVVDDRDGRVADVNASALHTFGLAREDVLGRPALSLPLWRHPMARRALLRLLRRGEEIHEAAIALQRRTGEPLILEFSRSPIVLDGQALSLVAMRDVTALRQAEAEAQQLQSQLRESQKMEAVGTLAGGIAHDFNNILGAMLGNLWLARDDLGAAHPVATRLEMVWRGALRARDLVRQILTFSRRSPQKLRPVDLVPVVQESLAMLRATLPAGVALEVSVPGTALLVDADETQMQQVVMNLCTNAWQAMPEAKGRIHVQLGAVTVGAGPSGADGEPSPVAPSAGGYVRLSVSDDGSGMAEEVRARVFEPFFTTKAPGQGTGLGLAVVHGIVAAHRGLITVHSVPGGGSRFDVWLPALSSSVHGTEPPAPGADAPAGRGEHVLYIDDDEVMVAMVGTLLERAGYRVTGIAGGPEAVARLQAAPEDFDLVVTDYNMPGMNGLDVLQAMRRMGSGLPVIVSTGYVDDRLAATAASAGFSALIYKENSIDELVAVVRRVLDGERPLADADPQHPGPGPAR